MYLYVLIVVVVFIIFHTTVFRQVSIALSTKFDIVCQRDGVAESQVFFPPPLWFSVFTYVTHQQVIGNMSQTGRWDEVHEYKCN